MSKYKLLIVESPTKAKTIQKYLGDDFKVIASKGHIKDLPIKELGVEVNDNFKMKIVPMKGKNDVIKEVKNAAKDASVVFLGPDPDREGEAIAFHLKSIISNKEIKRVLFHSITKETVKDALDTPTELDQKKYEAQKARRVLDRLVGYKISPLICNALEKKVSAGRVQSVALRLIIEREQEIEAFIPDHWFNVKAKLEKEGKQFESNFFGKDSKDKIVLENEDQAKNILADIKGKIFVLENKEVKDTYKKPSPPFTTSKLQQEASRKLKFSSKKTMEVAQKLYEGINITGEGSVGLITYMRTDSTRTDPGALKTVRELIKNEYGDEYLEPETVIYGKKGKNTQDAHEAIRPSKLTLAPDKIKDDLDPDCFKLYQLIWNKFVSSQMKPSKYEQTTMFFNCEGHFFKTVGSVLIFDGFKKVFEETQEEKQTKKGDEEEESGSLPILSEGDSAEQYEEAKLEAKKSSPPSLYTESTLVEMLEKKGIGRPSTYAAIISNLMFRKYIEKKTGKFSSTDLGRKVLELLLNNFADQFEVSFTSKIEKELDLIENGDKNWLEVMDKFWGKLKNSLTTAQAQEIFQFKNTKEQETVGIKCDKCDGEYVIKKSSKGEFLGCSNYPTCKSTKDFKKIKGEIKIVDNNTYHKDPCPKCGKKLVLKKGKNGEFFGCTGYPECKHIQQKGIKPCPKCEDGELVLKKGKYGEFLGCNKYPTCKYMQPKPIGPCPECLEGDVVERKGKDSKFWGCSRYPNCKFTTGEKPKKKDLEQKVADKKAKIKEKKE